METNLNNFIFCKGRKNFSLVAPSNSNLHHLPFCSFKVEKKLFRIKNYEISGFCCLKKIFYSNYDNAQRPKDGGSESDENVKMKHHVVEFMEKVFHLSADDVRAALLFCVKQNNCCYGMPCNWIKNAFLAFPLLRVSLLNLKCFFRSNVKLEHEENNLQNFNLTFIVLRVFEQKTTWRIKWI